jgi:hypothetical protein
MVKKKRKKKQKELTTTEKFHQKFPAEFNSFKLGDQLVYTRLSDSKRSLGEVRYFYVNCERPYVIMIDLLLRNFQSGWVDEIDPNPPNKEKKALLAKGMLKNSRS